MADLILSLFTDTWDIAAACCFFSVFFFGLACFVGLMCERRQIDDKPENDDV